MTPNGEDDHVGVLRRIRAEHFSEGLGQPHECGNPYYPCNHADHFAAEIAALDYALALSETLRNWGIRRKEGGGDPMLLICHAEHGGVGVSERPEEARIIPEAMLFLLARDLMQADTTGGQS